MRQRMNRKVTLMVLATLVALPAVAFPQGRGSRNAIGDVQLELVGQFINLTPTSSQQFGYLTYINGISGDEPIFSTGPQDETTALFTFYNDTANERVISNGPFRITNRIGTSTIYLDTAHDGNFSNPDSFRNGIPVQTSTLRQQVVFNTGTGDFTATFVNTITSSDFFNLGNHHFVLGKRGQTFRMTFFGHLATLPGHFAGFAVGPYLTRD